MTRFFLTLAAAFCLYSSPAFANLQTDVQNWLNLRDSSKQYEFQTYARFLETHKNWPESNTLTMRAEQALLKNATDGAILSWFKTHKPVTDMARFRYVIAMANNGDTVAATQYLQQTWRDGFYGDDMQAKVLQRFGGSLRGADFEARADKLLWQNQLDRAVKAILRVPNAAQRETDMVRVQLQRGSAKALGDVAQLSATQRLDNGLLLDLARYYRLRGNDEMAARTMAQRREAVGDYAAQWWKERSILSRRALEDGNIQLAYNLARAHGAAEGSELAEAEWFAGWLAVTRLHQPAQAYKHFETMYHNVSTPISVARASYWAGIAADQMKNKTLAAQWYRLAAVHMNTFYGQLGAYALGTPRQSFAAFFAKSRPARSFSTAGLPNDLIGAARILNNMQRERERDLFLRAALRVATENKNAAAFIQVAQSLNSFPLALAAAKAAYDKGVLVDEALFPRLQVPANRYVEPALTLGIIRQESLFDRFATSKADARGLMQLLPSTAAHTAQQSGIPYAGAASLYQPTTNMVLGQGYVTKMLGRYDSFVPLAAAAYNAGPGNVDKWLAQTGDPRKSPYSWVDWVERIPFYETRNYVQRVWESYTAYQYLLSPETRR